MKPTKFRVKVNNKLKGAYAETDFEKKTITINRKRHKNKKIPRINRNRDGTEKLLDTKQHEIMHVLHPKMTEKDVRKKTKKKLKGMSRKQKQKVYNTKTIISRNNSYERR